jgi:CheY-like chemotaxis protein
MRRILEKMLSGYEVLSAADGNRAVELFKQFKPDIVLMDIVLPEKSGIDVAKEILEDYPDAKIIAVTAYARKNRDKILEIGMLEILEKPFKTQDLIRTIEKYRV